MTTEPNFVNWKSVLAAIILALIGWFSNYSFQKLSSDKEEKIARLEVEKEEATKKIPFIKYHIINWYDPVKCFTYYAGIGRLYWPNKYMQLSQYWS